MGAKNAVFARFVLKKCSFRFRDYTLELQSSTDIPIKFLLPHNSARLAVFM